MNDHELTLRSRFRQAEGWLSQDQLEILDASRKQALRRARFQRWPAFLAPAIGMAAASVIAAILIFTPSSESPTPLTQGDFASTDSAEFYRDLDFYYWLAQQDKSERS